MEAIQQQIVEAKMKERPYALKEIKCLTKKFWLGAGILKGWLAEEQKKR